MRTDYIEGVGTIEILEEHPVSNHPDDWYLSLVLAYTKDRKYPEYVTWIKNISSGKPSYNIGHYFSEKEEAYEDYNERLFIYAR